MLMYIIITCTFVVFTGSSLLDSLQKCNFVDFECKKVLYKGMVNNLASGAPDMGIPPLDPIKISGVSVNFPDSMELTLSDGLLEGMKECSYDYINTNIETQHTIIKLTCNLHFNGKYKVKGGQDSVHGEGNGKISLSGLKMTIDFPFYVISRDGETYIICKFNEITHLYELTGNTTFACDDLGLDDKNKKIISYLNENSNVIKEAFLPLGINKPLEFYRNFVDKIFSTTPAKNFISTDLAPYIKVSPIGTLQ